MLSSIFCCCSKSSQPIKRTITLGCFGTSGAGKSTLLKLLKGEDPRGVLTTNGFSMLEMTYDSQINLRIYDVGGSEGIRDIWPNYYGEVYGIIFVVDYSTEEKFNESIEVMSTVTKHPLCSKKPILFVINNRNNVEIDDVEFSNRAHLQATSDTQQQMVMVTHISKYNGYLNNIRNPSMNVYDRARKDRNAFQDQFVAFIELIVEHYVYLSEGVLAAERALQIKQQDEKVRRQMILTKLQHDAVKAEIAQMENRLVNNAEPAVITAQPVDVVQDEPTSSPPLSLASSTIPSDIIQGSPELTPPPGQIKISQTSTKPASPQDIKNDEYFLPPKSPGRRMTRIQRIQSSLGNRVAPI